jgi:hypothetical protein
LEQLTAERLRDRDQKTHEVTHNQNSRPNFNHGD